MPLYQVLTVEGTLTAEQREKIADRIVRAHIEETDAPGELVHCAFQEVKPGHMFTNYERSRTSSIRVLIRAGRTTEIRHRLLQRISDVYVEEAGVPVQTVVVEVADLPAEWAMEGGHVLPAPHDPDEEARLARIRGPFLDRPAT